jgi:multidrug efflux system membrane fusion protein
MRIRSIAALALGLALAIGTTLYLTEIWPPTGKTAAANIAPAMPRGVPVVAVAAQRQDMPVEVTAIGTSQASETVVLRSRIDGEIVAVHFKEGDEVKAGEPLFTLDSRALEAQLRQAEANLARDRAQLQNAKRDLDRKIDLSQREFATKMALDLARATHDGLSGTAKAAEAVIQNLKVQISYTTIRAPIDGRTGALAQTKGNMVRANDTQPLVTINSVRPIKVAFAVPQRFFDDIRKAMAAGTLQTLARAAGDGMRAQPGEVTFIDNQIDATTGTFQLKASFANRTDALWPGMMVTLVVRLGVEPGVLTVPSAAVNAGQQGPFVFVVRADQTTEMRAVKVAREAGDLTVIAEGLAEGEQVVTDGQLRLGDGTLVALRAADAGAPPAPSAPSTGVP